MPEEKARDAGLLMVIKAHMFNLLSFIFRKLIHRIDWKIIALIKSKVEVGNERIHKLISN